MRALSPVEAALAFAIGGSVLAVAVPAFVKNVRASRLSEPVEGVQRLARRATQLADSASQLSAYPESAPLTPAQVARGAFHTDPPGTWAHPTWRLLDFSFDTPHAYSFEFVSKNAAEGSTFSAIAHGDLDGDGVLSTFRISGKVAAGGVPETSALEVMREVE